MRLSYTFYYTLPFHYLLFLFSSFIFPFWKTNDLCCFISFWHGKRFEPCQDFAEEKGRMEHNVGKEHLLTRRKSTDWSKDKNKDKAPLAPTSLPPRSHIISLKVVWDPIKTTTQKLKRYKAKSLNLLPRGTF